MDPLTMAALTSAGMGLTSAWGQHQANEMQRDLAMKQMGFSAKQADIQRSFQGKMSGTAFQRSMGDMRAAGLNPMLAFMQGGASTPSGAMGSAPGGISPGSIAEAGISSAREMQEHRQNMNIMREQQWNIAADRALKNAQTNATQATRDYTLKNEQLLDYELTSARNVARVADSRLGRALAPIDAIRRALIGGGSFLQPLQLTPQRSQVIR